MSEFAGKRIVREPVPNVEQAGPQPQTERARHEVIYDAIDKIVAANPKVSMVDLDAWLTTSGLATNAAARPDGIHIIPPFSSDEGNAFPGYNWSSAGQAILLNGCAAVVPSPTPTQTSASPTPTDTSASPSPTDTSASAVPAGSGDIVLSVMGIVLLVAGVAGLVASIVWMVARRRPAA